MCRKLDNMSETSITDRWRSWRWRHIQNLYGYSTPNYDGPMHPNNQGQLRLSTSPDRVTWKGRKERAPNAPYPSRTRPGSLFAEATLADATTPLISANVLVMQERSCELWNQKSVIEVAFSRCEAEVESGRLCSPSGFHPRIHHIDSPGRIPGAPDGAESPTRGHMYRPIHIHEVRGRYPFCFPFPFRDLIRISVTNCTAVRISSPMMKKCLDAIGHELTIVKMRSHGLYIPVMLSATLRVKGVILTGSTGSINRSSRSGFELHFRSFPSTGADRKVGAIDPTPLRSEGLRDRFIGGRSGEVGVLSVR
ncbi:hypothetical protein GEV33_011718 [Tenebrio molitor]|uniref:Uncharacterized protein n=1 Tax=Tenebrio molitor TaxID=7067 RepID=A0A8J6L4D8_TENMO|nr:hypothetical protein GEV33_011718 [Tenebrio molitor]